MQVLPELDVGGVERGTLEIAAALVAAGHRALVVSAGGRLVNELNALGAEHITVAVGRKRLSSLRYVRTLRALYRQHQVDIVHARSRLPAWLGWLARRGLPDAEQPRWVTTVHGPYSVNRYSRIMVSGEAVIAISDFIDNYISENYPGIEPQRVAVIPRGVDPQRYAANFAPSAEWLSEWQRLQPNLAGKMLLTLPGRLTRWKGQRNFIELIAQLRQRGYPVHGLLVGAAHPRKLAFESELRAQVAELKLSDAVSFLGTRADLREILSISRCAYSLTEAPEAFGRTTIEALALGTPVIGYAHGGTGEILRRVFPQGQVDTGDLAAAVARSESVLSAEQSNDWQVPATHPYTVQAMQQATLALYQRLAAGA